MTILPRIAIALAFLALCPVTVAAARPPWDFLREAETPHPAVVRVVVPDRHAVSHGSGTLVAVNDRFGLVVTNWHVVQDSIGTIAVLFPDGFRSQATLLGTDRDWDLAALAIWRPHVRPVDIATEPPRPGQALSIAGYGGGDYRTDSGRCTQYVAPGKNYPYEIVELSATARQGDSGGPIFNSQGELAGVLFGSTSRTTAGSYCGRVRWFLDRMAPKFHALEDTAPQPFPPGPEEGPSERMLAADPSPRPTAPQGAKTEPSRTRRRPRDTTASSSAEVPEKPPRKATPPVTASIAAAPPTQPAPQNRATEGESTAGPGEDAPPTDANPVSSAEPAVWQPAPTTRLDQIKNFLAILGLFSLLFHGLRLVAPRERVEEEEEEEEEPKPVSRRKRAKKKR